jgi:hypothetical protein
MRSSSWLRVCTRYLVVSVLAISTPVGVLSCIAEGDPRAAHDRSSAERSVAESGMAHPAVASDQAHATALAGAEVSLESETVRDGFEVDPDSGPTCQPNGHVCGVGPPCCSRRCNTVCVPAPPPPPDCNGECKPGCPC